MAERGTIVYDADCGFCTACAAWLGAHGTAGLKPWQAYGDHELAALGLTVDDVTTRVYWLDAEGRVAAGGERAVAAALRTCRGPLPLLGRLTDLPPVRPLAGVVYRWVARNRYRMPGSTDACRMDGARGSR